MAITGLKSLQYGTVIYFENTKYIEVTIPYTFVYKMARKYFTFPPFILITLINLYYVYIQAVSS